MVTAKSTDTFTIDRAEGDTTAKEIEAGWRVSNALFLDDIPDTFDDLADGSTNKAFTGTLKTKLDGIETAADVTDATNVAAAGAVMEADTSTASMSFVVDEDNMASNSATKLSTQQSIKAYVDAAIATAKQALLPIGTIMYFGVSTNPNTLYGFGTWTRIEGKFIVGVSNSDSDFDLNDTGGTKTETLTTSQIPSHSHAAGTLAADSNGNHTHTTANAVAVNNGSQVGVLTDGGSSRSTSSNGAHTHTISGSTATAGSGSAHNNLPPFIAKYAWERTA